MTDVMDNFEKIKLQDSVNIIDTIGLVKAETWWSFLPDEEKVRIYNLMKENGKQDSNQYIKQDSKQDSKQNRK